MTGADASGYRRRLLLWGGVAGAGLGASVDVILFHLITGHHHLLSNRVDPGTAAGLRQNVVYDGLFLAAMLGLAALGAAMLWRTANGAAARLSTTYLAGALVLGAGGFNLYDGVVDHYVLDLHDVVHGTTAWNPHWIGVSVAMLAVGGLLLAVSPGPIAERQDGRGSRRSR